MTETHFSTVTFSPSSAYSYSIFLYVKHCMTCYIKDLRKKTERPSQLKSKEMEVFDQMGIYSSIIQSRQEQE